MELLGAVCVVTGSASGIGRATAIALARAGSDVVVPDIDVAGAEATAREIEATGRRALPLRVDMTDREEVEGLVGRAIAWQGHCEVFVSNVGVGCAGAPHEFSFEQWKYLIDINLWSAIWPLRHVVPHMVERGRGHLVFVTSGAGLEGQADRAPYNVAKFGIVGLAESVARYLGPLGVDVSLVVPGAVATDGWKLCVFADDIDRDEAERKRAELQSESSRWPTPESMASAIIDGIREQRYAIIQHNPHQPGWFADILERKARDPDGFVLGRSAP